MHLTTFGHRENSQRDFGLYRFVRTTNDENSNYTFRNKPQIRSKLDSWVSIKKVGHQINSKRLECSTSLTWPTSFPACLISYRRRKGITRGMRVLVKMGVTGKWSLTRQWSAKCNQWNYAMCLTHISTLLIKRCYFSLLLDSIFIKHVYSSKT